MPVVFVRRDGVPPEAPVLRDVERQLIVVPEEDRFAVAALDQLGRHGAIEGPQGRRILVGELTRAIRVLPEARGEREVLWVTQVRGGAPDDPRIVAGGDLRPLLRGFDGHLRRKIPEALVCPDGAWGATLNGTGAPTEQGVHVLLRLV